METQDKMNDKLVGEFVATFSLLKRFNCPEAIDQLFKKMITADWGTESF